VSREGSNQSERGIQICTVFREKKQEERKWETGEREKWIKRKRGAFFYPV
jgi:hypothetical protein